jgi:hypothetical protein
MKKKLKTYEVKIGNKLWIVLGHTKPKIMEIDKSIRGLKIEKIFVEEVSDMKEVLNTIFNK